MDTIGMLASAVAGYLIGSISSARIVTSLFAGKKRVPEETTLGIEGSDKKIVTKLVSATTVSTNVGPKFGFMTYVLDVLKVFIPAFLLRRYYPDTQLYLVFATTAVVGHIWPIYHQFRGGRGISAIYGGIFAFDWLAVLVGAISGLIFGLLILRDLYLTYTIGLLFLVPWFWFRTHDPSIILYIIIVNILLNISALPESRQWYKIKKEAKWNDPAQAFQISAMGRGIMKMARKLGFFKEQASLADSKAKQKSQDNS
jgi:glycerol-3-phosphate acyltransferase PlsY